MTRYNSTDRQNHYASASAARKLITLLAGLPEQFRRWKRTCLLLLLGTLFLCLILCVATVFLVGRASAQEAAPLPLDALLLIDHSNSMWDKGGVGSDPDLLRVQAANLFIAYLGVDTARAGSRLGVIHFGGESVLAVPLTLLDSTERRQAIREAIADPQRMDWTDPLEALQLAYETLFPNGQRDPARQPVVILLSDGKPEFGQGRSFEEWAAYVADLRALVSRFREQECPIFTIALSNEATDADTEIQTVYRNLWQEIAACTEPAEYREARAADDLPTIYHTIVARLAGAEAAAPIVETPVDGEVVETVTVEDGLAQVTFVVLRSDPALEVRLMRPGGAPASPEDPDVERTGEPGATREEIWAITDPRPGRWTLELHGNGTVVVWQDVVPQTNALAPAYAIQYAIQVEELPAFIPSGQPVEVELTLHGAAIEEALAEQDLQIVAELRRAGFAEETLLARDDGQGCDGEAGDGRYCILLANPPPGACTLHLRALLAGDEVAQREIAFDVVALPELEIVSPRPGTRLSPSAPISVEVRVEGFSRNPVSSLAASLHGADGEPISVNLTEADGGLFVGHCSAPDTPGPLTLTVRLRGQTAEGLPFDDVARVGLEVLSLQTAGSGEHADWILPLAGLAGLAALGGAGGLLVRRRWTRATLDGGLRMLAAPPGQPAGAVLELPATPTVVLGGTDKGAVPLPGEVPRVTLRAGSAPEGGVETWVAPLAGDSETTTALNGSPLKSARLLRDGDVLTLGSYRLRYENLRQAGARRARHRPRRKASSIGGVR